MGDDLEKEASEAPIVLDKETLARLEKERKYWREQMRCYTDPLRKSRILTAEDYMTTMNC